MPYISEFREIIKNISIALGKEINMNQIEIIDRGCPFIPPKHLPKGKMAIYSYWYNGKFLKIGKAGPKSEARFTYQHLSPSAAQSTLAKSILNDPEMPHSENIADWIKTNCRRVDILLDSKLGYFALELIEAALHYRYEPRYEGYKSQR